MENNAANSLKTTTSSSAFRAGAVSLGLVALMGLAACDLDVEVVEDEAGNATITVDDTTEGTGPELIIEESDDNVSISGDWVEENVSVNDGTINIDTTELEDEFSDDED